MFGNPHWFRPKSIGWGLVPITWQGWTYTAAWVATIVTPFLLLVAVEKPVEAFAWMTLGIGGLILDVRQILRTMRGGAAASTAATAAATPKRDENVLYITDTNAGAPIATRNYRLQVRH